MVKRNAMATDAPNVDTKRYRPDIDGLRAVAVMAVVLFHAFPSVIRGGFVGVDIFFVISGFLITGIILNGLQAGTFSFGSFYSHRIRRIFPALFAVLLTCLMVAVLSVFVIGKFVLLTNEFKELMLHIAGGAGFISNLLLWIESGYFDSASETKILLHLWSLGIEEQFYIFWPPLLLLAWRLKMTPLKVAGSILLLSFAYNRPVAKVA